ncbi:hypothetical protein YPPY103_3167, partial [Yersinia pestis PY-103]
MNGYDVFIGRGAR